MRISSALNALSAVYLAGASVFGLVMAYQRNPEMAAAADRMARIVWPAIQRGAQIANDQAVQPALQKMVELDKSFFDAIDPPRTAMAAKQQPPKPAERRTPRVAVAQAPAKRAANPVAPLPLRPAITELKPMIAAEAPKPSPAVPIPKRQAEGATSMPGPAAKPLQEIAPSRQASIPPHPDLAAPSAAELTRVTLRLRDNLTREMLANFELFLYVSKADRGPWAQRMYVFRKTPGGDLDLLYNWPVSTGRELVEFTPGGAREPSFTPQGYYELDPERMYRHHTSGQWGSPMPFAMFFNWENHGYQTGLAIHGATGEDIALLGHRASAGCVRLAPENAALLFNLIRKNYRGLAPRFAYDRRTATMSNDGLLMHDARGNLKFAEGYKVLVFIENYGGENVVAAVF